MQNRYSAVVKEDEGWVIEVPGVNSQGKTREELLANLRSALREALEMNREEALRQAEGGYIEEALVV